MNEYRSFFNKAKAGVNHDIQQAPFFIEKGIVSAGWSFEGKGSYASLDEYKKMFKEEHKDISWNRQSLHYLFDNLNKGDFIWILNEGVYYVAQLPDYPKNLFQYTNSREFLEHDSSVYIKNINWKKVGTEENVPGSVSTAKGRLRGAVQRIDNNDPQIEINGDHYTLTSLLAKHAVSNDFFECKLKKEKIFDLLGSSELEDLLGMFLFSKYGYEIIPSTNKIGTQKYEYVMVDGTGKSDKKIYIQTKNGNINLNTDDYKDLILTNSKNEVWLLTTRGKINDDVNMKFIKFSGDNGKITLYRLSELIEFIFNNQNTNILPPTIKKWVDLFKWY